MPKPKEAKAVNKPLTEEKANTQPSLMDRITGRAKKKKKKKRELMNRNEKKQLKALEDEGM